MSDQVKTPGPDHPMTLAFKELVPEGDPGKGMFLQMVENAKQPRSFKTHLPLSLLPKDMLDKAKVFIYQIVVFNCFYYFVILFYTSSVVGRTTL